MKFLISIFILVAHGHVHGQYILKHDIDYDENDYLELPDTNQGQLSHSVEDISPDLPDVNAIENELQAVEDEGSLGDAIEKILADNQELLWHSIFAEM